MQVLAVRRVKFATAALAACFAAMGIAGTASAGVSVVPTPKATDSIAFTVATQPDGKVLAAGDTAVGRKRTAATVTRMLPDGTLDATFGKGGVKRFGSCPGGFATQVVPGPDGGMVVAGGCDGRKRKASDFVARLLPDGSPDPSFAGTGTVRTGVRSFDMASTVVEPAGESLVMVRTASKGPVRRPDRSAVVITRLLADGTPDPAFGSGGVATIELKRSFRTSDVFVAGDGAIQIAGVTYDTFVRRGVVGEKRWKASMLFVGSDGTLAGPGDVGLVPLTLTQRQTGLGMPCEPMWPSSTFDQAGRLITFAECGRGRGMGRDTTQLLVRYDEAVLDPSFPPVVMPRTPSIFWEKAYILEGGSFLVAGWAKRGQRLAKLTPDGELDMTFGKGGVARIDARVATVFSFAEGPDGNLYSPSALSRPVRGADGFRFAVGGLLPTGLDDPDFGKPPRGRSF